MKRLSTLIIATLLTTPAICADFTFSATSGIQANGGFINLDEVKKDLEGQMWKAALDHCSEQGKSYAVVSDKGKDRGIIFDTLSMDFESSDPSLSSVKVGIFGYFNCK
jgi:hypothetical protein